MALTATLEVQVSIDELSPILSFQTVVASNIPSEIFVFEQLLTRDAAGCYLTEFSNVASLQQMTELPADDFIIGNAFKRESSASLTFESYKELNENLETLKAAIEELLKRWNDKLIFEDNEFILTFPYA